jgi:hypothetical protein
MVSGLRFEISNQEVTSRGLTIRHCPFTTEPPMAHSIALVTGATSGLGFAAAPLLAGALEVSLWLPRPHRRFNCGRSPI